MGLIKNFVTSDILLKMNCEGDFMDIATAGFLSTCVLTELNVNC